jgi:hypothetical protein
MAEEYRGQNPIDIANQAERDLNSHSAKHGHDAGYDTNNFGASDSSKDPSFLSSLSPMVNYPASTPRRSSI